MKDHLYEQRYKYPKDLTGFVFNKWTVLSDAGKNKFGTSSWLCRCDCGNESIVSRKNLTMGKSRSCIRKCTGLSLKERLFLKVNITDTCWNWTGTKDKLGYGRIFQKEFPDIRPFILTHRASWMVHKGKIPEGLLVLHTCDNPCCINPEHLFLGTNQDNCNDKMKKGRHKSILGQTWKLKSERKSRCLMK